MAKPKTLIFVLYLKQVPPSYAENAILFIDVLLYLMF